MLLTRPERGFSVGLPCTRFRFRKGLGAPLRPPRKCRLCFEAWTDPDWVEMGWRRGLLRLDLCLPCISSAGIWEEQLSVFRDRTPAQRVLGGQEGN